MKNYFKKAVLFGFVFGSLALYLSSSVHAAQLGQVTASEGVVYSKPDQSSRVLGRVPKGGRVAASNRSTSSGFYRVKTKSGLLGWMYKDDLVFRRKQKGSKQVRRGSKGPDKAFRVGLGGGLLLFKAGDFNDTIGITQAANGTYFDLELAYRISNSFAILLRGDFINKTIPIEDQTSGNSYELKFGSLPIMVGGELGILNNPTSKFHIQFAGLLGMGLGTKGILTQTGEAVATEYSKSAFTFMGKLNFDLKFSDSFGVMAEAGYRYLNASSVVPTAGTGGTVLLGNPLPTLSVNLSGPIIGISAYFCF